MRFGWACLGGRQRRLHHIESDASFPPDLSILVFRELHHQLGPRGNCAETEGRLCSCEATDAKIALCVTNWLVTVSEAAIGSLLF